MDCRNCGAPMTLVPDKDYFHCAYCASYFFPEEDADGVRVLGEPSGASCAVCGVELVSASVEGARLLCCPRCRGLLIPQPIFYTVVGHLRRKAAGGIARRPAPLNRDELRRRVDCPRCGRSMDTHPYFGPGNIVIDLCQRCGLIWLDHGELSRVIHAPGGAHERWQGLPPADPESD